MAVFCNEFVDIQKQCENVDSFVLHNFMKSYIFSGRKWRPAWRTLSFIFTNVLLETHQKQDSENYLNFTYSRDNNQKAHFYAGHKIGVKSMKKALVFLESEGWTTHRKGYNSRKNINGVNPYKLGVECINYEKFSSLYRETVEREGSTLKADLDSLGNILTQRKESGVRVDRGSSVCFDIAV